MFKHSTSEEQLTDRFIANIASFTRTPRKAKVHLESHRTAVQEVRYMKPEEQRDREGTIGITENLKRRCVRGSDKFDMVIVRRELRDAVPRPMPSSVVREIRKNEEGLASA